MLCIHIECIEMYGLHELILYVLEDYYSMLLCIHIDYMEMYGCHELFFFVSEDNLFCLLCRHNGFDLCGELILCGS